MKGARSSVPSGNGNFVVSLLFVLAAGGCGGGGGGGDQTPPATNNAPTATSANITTSEDAASAPTVPVVTDPDAGDTHTLAIVTQPAHGSAAVVNNRLVYTPDPDYNGADNFTFSATDTGGLAVTGTATVTVTPVNDAPTATGASRSIYSGIPGGGSRTPWVDDVDIFDTATFQIASSPSSGVASLVGNVLTYAPNVTSGTDAFTFTATDGGGASVSGAMRVVVFNSTALTTCTRVGMVNVDGTFGNRAFSHPCAQFQRADTRVGSAVAPITIDYIRNWPTNTNTL